MSDTLFLAESLEDLMSTFLTSVDPVHINRNSARGKVFVLILGSSCPSVLVIASGTLFFMLLLIKSSCRIMWPVFYGEFFREHRMVDDNLTWSLVFPDFAWGLSFPQQAEHKSFQTLAYHTLVTFTRLCVVGWRLSPAGLSRTGLSRSLLSFRYHCRMQAFGCSAMGWEQERAMFLFSASLLLHPEPAWAAWCAMKRWSCCLPALQLCVPTQEAELLESPGGHVAPRLVCGGTVPTLKKLEGPMGVPGL